MKLGVGDLRTSRTKATSKTRCDIRKNARSRKSHNEMVGEGHRVMGLEVRFAFLQNGNNRDGEGIE